VLQVNNLPVLFDMDEFKDPINGSKFSALLSLRDADKSPYVRALRDVLASIDAATLNAALASSQDWFGKPYKNVEVLAENYQYTLSEPLDKTKKDGSKHTPRVKVKLLQRDGAFETEIYNERMERVDAAGDGSMTVGDVFKRGSSVTAILECTGVWVVDKKFGLSWRVAQVVAKKRAGATTLVTGRPAFQMDADAAMGGGADDDADMEAGGEAAQGGALAAVAAAAAAAAAPVPVPAPAAPEAPVVDDAMDEEEDDEEEEAAEPPPPVKPVAAAKPVVVAAPAKARPVLKKK
jgi:hypothetical protein